MTAGEELSLSMTRSLPATRTEVWSAMTDPGQLARWWGPKGFATPSVEFEPSVGASYRIAMRPPEGEPFHLIGELREVVAPERLAFTFVWDPATPDDRETLATLTLREQGEGTAVELTQGEFATEERRALHEDGWAESFDKLEELLG
jgi:uncharacterized protein YndB with AHSA1/START domain